MKYCYAALFLLTALLAPPRSGAQCSFTVYKEIDQPTSCGAGNGALDVTPTSGTPPFTYVWSNGGSSHIISGVMPGRYIVVITDAASCVVRDTTYLTAPPFVTVSVTQTITCFGASTGSLKASGLCGQRYSSGYFYQYRWYKVSGSTGILLTTQADSIAAGLDAGTYYAVIKDANNDTARSSNIVLTQPSRISPAASVTAPACNGGTDGSVTLSAIGGSGSYTYAKGAGAYSSSGVFGSQSAGTFVFHVKDAAACIRDTTLTVGQPAAISIGAAVTQVTCNGAANGSVSITASGGTPGYTYARGTGAYGSSASFTGLGPATYVFHTKDAAGCIKDTTITITQPTLLALAAEVTDPSGSTPCDGDIDITPTGGTPPFTYAWSNGPTTQDISGLCPGTYIVTTTDARGCTRKDTFYLATPLSVTVAQAGGISCNGGADGQIVAHAAGGQKFSSGLPYQYKWYRLSGSTPTLLTGQTDSVATALSAGQYYATVTDAASHTVTSATITLTGPSRIIPAASVANAACFNGASGAVTITATGGTGAYTFAKDAGAYGASGAFPALAAGAYAFHVKDANGCIRDTAVTITQPSRIVPAALVTNVSCFGGNNASVSISATGGAGPFNYALGAGIYLPSGGFNGLSAGTYVFHVRDANGCIQDTTVSPGQPTAITTTISNTPVSCFGSSTGIVSLAATGGTPGYTYARDGGAYGSSAAFTGLPAGSYIFRVKDAAGCTQNSVVTVTQPTRIIPAVALTAVACFGDASGAVSISAIGGGGGYTFARDAGAYGAFGTFNTLAAGTFVFHVKDAADCIRDTAITITQPARIVPAAAVTNASCFGGSNGAVTLSTTGGTGSYTFAQGTGAYSASGAFGGLSAGAYLFHVKDAAGCIRDTSLTITQPLLLTVSVTATPVSCFGGTNGTVTATVAGGTGPYHYEWSTNDTLAAIIGMKAGTYFLAVKDALGCEAQTTATIASPDSIRLTPVVTMPSCHGSCDGAISLLPTGGTAPYTYAWSNSSTAKDQNALCPGAYSLTLTDAKGCQATAFFTLDNPAALTVNAGPDHILCKTGSFTLHATASDSAARFDWLSNAGFSASGAGVTISQPATYYVIATSKGCTGRDTVVITQTMQDIQAEFVAATQAFKDSLYRIVNISSPDPDSVSWVLPGAPHAVVASRSKYMAELVFKDTGTYVITMTARSGQCEKTVEDKVLVVEGQPYAPVTGNPHRAYIRAFTIAPNPSSGKFSVHIELDEDGPVRLRLLSLQSSAAADDRQDGGKKLYDFAYDLALQSGQYLLLLETAHGSQSLKLTLQ